MGRELKILQINIRSLRSNSDLLQCFLNDNNIDIAILNETWLQNGTEHHIQNYKGIYKNRDDGYGGVGFLIKNKINIKQQELNFTLETIEAIQIQLNIGNEVWHLMGFYNPPNNNTVAQTNDLRKILNKAENMGKTIIAGDINAHSFLWGEKNYHKGEKIAEIINNQDVKVLKNGGFTRFNMTNHTTSAIDITMSTPDI